MLKLGEKLVEAGVVHPEKKTTFPDGRMSTSEAYLYYRRRCSERTLPTISKMVFKWHLKAGNYLKPELVSNPFGNYPKWIYAIEKGSIDPFITALNQDLLKKTAPKSVTPNPLMKSVPTPRSLSKPSKPQELLGETLTVNQALRYLQEHACPCTFKLNVTTLHFYITYEVIDSTWVKNARCLSKDSLDAYLELFPTGIYKMHLDYETKEKLGSDDLTAAEAYAYYRSLDPEPLLDSTFRKLCQTAILPGIRTNNDPHARVLGFAKIEIEKFVKLRRLILANNPNNPGFKAHRSLVKSSETEAIPDAILDAILPQSEATPKTPDFETDESWVSVAEAYAYYCERVDTPLSRSRFQQLCYQGDFLKSKKVTDERANSLHDSHYRVRLDSVSDFLQSNPKTAASNRSYPVDQAFHKFSELLPSELTLLQFKRMVRQKLIPSFEREGIVRVRRGDLSTHFQGTVSVPQPVKAPVKAPAPTPPVETVPKPLAPVSLKMSAFARAEDLVAAIQLLTDQGIPVQVEP